MQKLAERKKNSDKYLLHFVLEIWKHKNSYFTDACIRFESPQYSFRNAATQESLFQVQFQYNVVFQAADQHLASSHKDYQEPTH